MEDPCDTSSSSSLPSPDRTAWAPLEIAAKPNWLTRHKLARLNENPGLCSAVLSGSALAHASVPDNDAGDGCGWQAAVCVGDARFDTACILTCPAAMCAVRVARENGAASTPWPMPSTWRAFG